ncbi:MAG: lipopolysaccharide biosynthesis protein [Pyrinomonadaceae bacterium]|nr:lipopolysaccharide biosynthesis protein [Sphingobacteriaceae bacterium]
MSNDGSGGTNSSGFDEISLSYLILKIGELRKYLISKWLIILLAGITGGFLGLVYSYFKKPIYNAELTFALEDDKASSGLGGALGLASQFGFDLGGGGGGAFSGDNLSDLMQSRKMIQKALLTEIDYFGKKQTLAELYIDFNNFRKRWKDKPELKDVHFYPGEDINNFSRIQDSLLGEFHRTLIKENLSIVKGEKGSTVITIDVFSKNEIFAKMFTVVLVDEVADFYIQTKTRKALKNVLILQHQTDSVRRVLNLAISGIAASVDANPNPNPSRQILRVPSQRRQVDVQANTAILSELVKNLEISKVSLRRETPLIQIIDSPILPLKKVIVTKITGILIGWFSITVICLIVLTVKKSRIA